MPRPMPLPPLWPPLPPLLLLLLPSPPLCAQHSPGGAARRMSTT